jgi:hypothetical protein
MDMKQVSAQQLSEARMRVAMSSPEHLKHWLDESGRRFLVLPAMELVDSLPWPHGVEALMQIIAAWRDHRMAQPSGRTHEMRHPMTGDRMRVPVMKGDSLEVEELDRAIRYLIGQVTAQDPTWKIENPPM